MIRVSKNNKPHKIFMGKETMCIRKLADAYEVVSQKGYRF